MKAEQQKEGQQDVESMTLGADQSTRLETVEEVQSKRKNPRHQLKTSDFVQVHELGAGGFGNVDLVRFADEGMARACKMPLKVALKRVFMGKFVNQSMKQ